jgi:hypothetical protein
MILTCGEHLNSNMEVEDQQRQVKLVQEGVLLKKEITREIYGPARVVQLYQEKVKRMWVTAPINPVLDPQIITPLKEGKRFQAEPIVEGTRWYKPLFTCNQCSWIYFILSW